MYILKNQALNTQLCLNFKSLSIYMVDVILQILSLKSLPNSISYTEKII